MAIETSSNTDPTVFGIGLIIGLFCGALIGSAMMGLSWRSGSVADGHGEYNQRTGAWQWKEQRKDGE